MNIDYVIYLSIFLFVLFLWRTLTNPIDFCQSIYWVHTGNTKGFMVKSKFAIVPMPQSLSSPEKQPPLTAPQAPFWNHPRSALPNMAALHMGL